MCGIAGVLWREPRHSQQSAEILERMKHALRHRGPDDNGLHVDGAGRFAFLNTRLAIRDLLPAGHMPMRSPDGRLCITYNGEIYNAEELREELRRLGYAFRSHSDTEVVLAGYQHWGSEVARKLRGMFAFAIADEAQLVLARDPLGIKPLYYVQERDRFAFASEIRAFVDGGLTSRAINATAISAYLQLGSIPAPLTIYDDVRALEPGQLLEIDFQLALRQRKYFHLAEPGRVRIDATVADLLDDAVRTHLVSDVPVGAFLSGGIDSAAIVALAAKHTEALVTCTVTFDEAAHDESAIARSVAQRFRTTHHEVHVTHNSFVDDVPNIINALDQPSIDGFNTWFISKAASHIGLKVVLSGLGGDELFGGYPTFRGVPRMLRAVTALQPVAGLTARAVSMRRGARWRKVADALRQTPSPESAFLTFRGLFTGKELGNSESQFDALDYVRERARGSGDLRDWVSRAELRTYTANQLLRDADAMSMAHSLELRVPFLDTRLVDSLLSLPSEERIGAGGKSVLREVMRTQLPDEVVNRRAKRGFTFPMQEWLAKPQARDLWDWNTNIKSIVAPELLTEVESGFRAGSTHWSRAWSLIVLNQWQRQ
ncbi:MAG TPA: asparagine synthase (glutamine-hydrolyzing) [Longimicrobiales bacterium]|nr:asparagine synthase (glutamine-hydrolyzing) [Longimicrobiales bacterium]